MRQYDRVQGNASLTTVVNGIHAAWTHAGDPNALVLMVVEEYTANYADQRAVEYALTQHAVEMVRMTLRECHEWCGLR